MVRITRILTIETGGYRSWAIVEGYGAGDVVLYGDKIYYLHPGIPAYPELAESLGVSVGTRVAGVRWTETATDEQIKRFQLN